MDLWKTVSVVGKLYLASVTGIEMKSDEMELTVDKCVERALLDLKIPIKMRNKQCM